MFISDISLVFLFTKKCIPHLIFHLMPFTDIAVKMFMFYIAVTF